MNDGSPGKEIDDRPYSDFIVFCTSRIGLFSSTDGADGTDNP